MKKLMIPIAMMILLVITQNVQAALTEKNILSYGSQKIESVQFDPSGNSIYFTSVTANNKSAIYLCRPATKKVYLISPLASGTGELYNSYSPRLSPDGKYMVYLRSSGEIFTPAFKRELVVRNLQTKTELVLDSTSPGNPDIEFSLSKKAWHPKYHAFTYTVVMDSNEPKSYVATAQYRTDSQWIKKVLDGNSFYGYTNAIWSPKGEKIACLVEGIIDIGPGQPPLYKQFLNIIHSKTGVWQLSLDISKSYPNQIVEIDWDKTENYIFYSHYSDEDLGYGHDGLLLGRIHLAVFAPFLEDDYGLNLFSSFGLGQVADGHIGEFFMDSGTGDLYVTREITNGAAFIEDYKETTQVIRIPFANQNTFFEITPVNIDDHVLESVNFNQKSTLLLGLNTGIWAYVKKKLGKVIAYGPNGQVIVVTDATLETYELWVFGDLK